MKKTIAGILTGVAIITVAPNPAHATFVHLCHFGTMIELPDWDTVAWNDHISHGDTLNCEATTIPSIEQETTTTAATDSTAATNTTPVPVPDTRVDGDTSTTSGSVPDTSQSSTTIGESTSTSRGLTVCESNPPFCEPPPISAPLGSTTTVVKGRLPVTGGSSGSLLLLASLFALAGVGLLIVRRR